MKTSRWLAGIVSACLAGAAIFTCFRVSAVAWRARCVGLRLEAGQQKAIRAEALHRQFLEEAQRIGQDPASYRGRRARLVDLKEKMRSLATAP
jgi:hypothetical protein